MVGCLLLFCSSSFFSLLLAFSFSGDHVDDDEDDHGHDDDDHDVDHNQDITILWNNDSTSCLETIDWLHGCRFYVSITAPISFIFYDDYDDDYNDDDDDDENYGNFLRVDMRYVAATILLTSF